MIPIFNQAGELFNSPIFEYIFPSQRELNNISSQFPGNNIGFLEIFVQEDCHLFKEQLQADLGYFNMVRNY